MLKIRATQKEVKNGCAYIIKVPFCALQNLLRMDDPCAYTAGREGWSADVYDFGLAVIVTGYAPFGNIEPPYEMLKEYNAKADSISDWRALAKLRNEFIQACIAL